MRTEAMPDSDEDAYDILAVRPADFSLEEDEDQLRISYRQLSKYPFLLILLGIGLSQALLRSLPAQFQPLLHPAPAQTWSLSYPENLVWLGPLGFSLFTLASLSLIYSGLALLIDRHWIEIDQDFICSYERPLPLSRRQKIARGQIEGIHWQEKLIGGGTATALSYPVYLRLKNGSSQALASFENEREARFMAQFLKAALKRIQT